MKKPAINKNARLSQDEIKKAIKWFYYSQLRQRYISQLPQKLDKDIGIVVKSAHPFDDLLNIIKAERPLAISSEEFVGTNTRSALWSLMQWYFKSRNAICFTTGIGIRQNMGKKYTLEHDHIFAYSVLKDSGYGQENRFKYAMAQEITNRAVLTQLGNRTKSNKLADEYLATVEQEFPGALALQCVPPDKTLWKLDSYEAFLNARRKLLADELNHFLENITSTAETAVETPIDELIAEGESDELEFKSSLRWSYQGACMDRRLEEVILKSVAAFANSDGGTLLIGVSAKVAVAAGATMRISEDQAGLHATLSDGTTLRANSLFPALRATTAS